MPILGKMPMDCKYSGFCSRGFQRIPDLFLVPKRFWMSRYVTRLKLEKNQRLSTRKSVEWKIGKRSPSLYFE